MLFLGEEETERLLEVLESPHLLKDVENMSPYYQTSTLESFHSTLLRFAPKHTAFSYMGMKTR